MIKQAREQSKESNLEVSEGSPESTPFLKEGEVDLASVVWGPKRFTQRFDPSFSTRLSYITTSQSNR